jgi:hypothetical protein
VSFGRKKRADLAAGMLTPPVESPIDVTSTGVSVERQVDGGNAGSGSSKSARELLKRF